MDVMIVEDNWASLDMTHLGFILGELRNRTIKYVVSDAADDRHELCSATSNRCFGGMLKLCEWLLKFEHTDENLQTFCLLCKETLWCLINMSCLSKSNEFAEISQQI